MYNLSEQAKLTRVSNAVAAGTTDVESSSVDMRGYDSVAFIVSMGAITAGAVTSANVEQSSDDSSFAELLGTGITIADDDDNQCVFLDVCQPRERYVRCVIERATQNAVVDSIVALQCNSHGGNVEPVTHDSTTVVGSEFHHAPAEGTA